MVFTLGGDHDDQIEFLLKQLQKFLELEAGERKIGLHHVVYFTAKFTLYHIVGKPKEWRKVLEECLSEREMDDDQFKHTVDQILDDLKKVVVDGGIL